MTPDLDALGDFFGVVAWPGAGAPWRPVRDLVEGPALDERVEHTRMLLAQMSGAEVEARVAASTMSLGLFARLVAPVLGATVLGMDLSRPTLDTTFWQPVTGGPWPLALVGEVGVPDLAGMFADVLLPLAEAITERHSLSSTVVLGNVASAVFGAARMVGQARADLADAAVRVATELLAGPLAGTGDYGTTFTRSSCCLYYRIPGGGYCGDCVLADR